MMNGIDPIFPIAGIVLCGLLAAFVVARLTVPKSGQFAAGWKVALYGLAVAGASLIVVVGGLVLLLWLTN